MSLQDKYKRPTPKRPPKKKGNSDVIEKIVQDNNRTLNTEIQGTVSGRNVKKATFELNADLHKKLRTFAAMNDTKMVNIVEEALTDYFDKHN